jgi:glutathionyl-hydroquinone reductase
MGLLVDGKWQDRWYDTTSTGGRFVREQAMIRNWVTADGAAGPTGDGGFKAEAGRYHLYVSYACPWAHRTLIVRELKGLQDAISFDAVHPIMGREGWVFDPSFPGSTPDRVNGKTRLYEVYLKSDPTYTGRVTTPVLWDKDRGVIVNNESADIIRMMNAAFVAAGASGPDLYPQSLHDEIDAINKRVYRSVNNGVYRCGFATAQDAYEEAFHELFEALDELEQRLGAQRYLAGDSMTEADLRLFTTLIRFDAVYFGHFKCNLRQLKDYHNLSNFVRELYQLPGVAGTVRFDQIKTHYYRSHPTINPTGIVPLGPLLDFTMPHDRDRISQAA